MRMTEASLSNANKNLFAQFLYNILLIKKHFKLNNVVIGLFCNPIYLSGTAFDKFREIFLKEFSYKDGILFNASNFADVSNLWGINFCIWTSGESTFTREFNHRIIEIENDELKQQGNKIIYNTDGGGGYCKKLDKRAYTFYKRKENSIPNAFFCYKNKERVAF